MIKVGDIVTPAKHTRRPSNTAIEYGKVYEVVAIWKEFDKNPLCGSCFTIIDDKGRRCNCLEYGCAHLGDGNWEVVNDSE